jgi:flagellar biosynthesis protein FlhB
MADSSKTEQATPQRKKKAREKGNVTRSRELSSVLALATVVGTVTLIAPSAITFWGVLYRELLMVASTSTVEANGPVLFWSSIEVFRWIVPVLLAALGVSMMASFAQGGLNFAPAAMQPKFDRFNPASKLGQIFSITGMGNLAKSLLPFAAILWITIGALREHWALMVSSSNIAFQHFAKFVGSVLFEIGWKSVLVMLVWSAVDYLLLWKKANSDLKMSKQEIKEEHKENDGNPVIKRRIHQVRRAMRRQANLKAAAQATVVITNPTHFAIALKYEQDMPAPIVVAKGADLIALKIREIAKENGITTIENKPLARALFKAVEVGDSIPSNLYQAVAEILVIVYRAQAEVRAQEAARRSRNASGGQTNTAPKPQQKATR